MDSDLYSELQAKTAQLDMSIKMLRKNGSEYAKAERDYKILLRVECLKLRDAGMPVGIIEKICYGIPAVAEKRFNRDICSATYEANKEAINALKLEMRLIESQIQREWGQADE